ncbi:MAG: molybdopterin cofactor-binding domain-containing protein [Chakrabartia sp.]
MSIFPSGEKPIALTRRGLLIGGGAAAGLLIAWGVWPRSYAPNLVAAEGEYIANAYLKIGTDGHITIAVPQAEMGQGSYTLLAQILADELGADWRTIAIEPAPLNPLYANTVVAMEWAEGLSTTLFGDAARYVAAEKAVRSGLEITGSSSTVRAFEGVLRDAGAAARVMLCKAAARQWDADWRACDTFDGFVVRGPDRLRFGALAARAVEETVPDTLPLRTGRENRLTGTNVPRLDLPSKVDGSANYTADIRLPGMVYAAIRMGPLGDSVFSTYDKMALKGQREVLTIITQERWIAVVAKTWWAANRALDLIKPRFVTDGPFPESAAIKPALEAALDAESVAAVEYGDVDHVFADGKLFSAQYAVDLAPHAAMEPMAATAAIRGSVLELWLPTQVPSLARKAAAHAISFDEADVVVHPMIIGGSFGRKYEVEIAVQAAVIARQVDAPVQLVWSRSEDMMQDRFRPAAAARMFARMGPAGQIEGWRARIAAPATLSEMKARIMEGQRSHDALQDTAEHSDPSITSGATPPYAIANVSVRHHTVNLGVPTGKWRSGADSYTAFFNESFIDELSKQSGVESFSFRMAMLGGNPRLAFCLSKVAILGGWEGGGAGTRQGIACHSMLGSHVAVLAEAHISDTQKVIVDRLIAVADVGRIIHPDIARQQIEGALIFGMAAATGNRVIVERGIATPRRLRDLALPTLSDCPEIIVELVPSREAPGGVGEVAVPPVAPAIANALFAGSGRRFRSLPLMPSNS